MSRRQRQRAQARPWALPPSLPEPAIDWQALAAERQQREQQKTNHEDRQQVR